MFRSPREFKSFLTMCHRTRWPWLKFKPCLLRNDAGQQWEVYFTEEMAVYSRERIIIDVGRGRESGKIVAMTIYDEETAAYFPEDGKKDE